MSANVETMAYQGEVPWHGLGTKVADDCTAAEMLKASGLDWDVELVPMIANGLPVTTHKAVMRKRNGHDPRILGVVGNSYRPVQNRDAFASLDAIRTSGSVQFHTAGALGGGEKVWVLCKLPGVIRPLADDPVEKFLLWVNGHDGGTTLKMLFTPVRVVCQNTLGAALSSFKSTKVWNEGVEIRHVGNMSAKTDQAMRALGLSLKAYDAVEDVYTRMAHTKISQSQLKAVLNGLFPYETTDRMTSDSKVGNAGIQNRIAELAETGRGTDIKGVHGTAWGLYNAITEYVDHERVTTGKGLLEVENRLKSQWFGSGAKIKQAAYESLASLA